MERGNIFSRLPDPSGGEIIENLAAPSGGRVERIVSGGHASPPDFWYRQDTDEWVMLAQGNAVLEEQGRADPIQLAAGDWLYIPAGLVHRVASASPDAVWLAAHFEK